MTPELVLTLIGVIVTAVLGGGFWNYRQSRKEAPIKQTDANIANAEKSQQMAMAIADDLREDYVRLREDLGTERDERQKLSGRVEELANHIREQDRTIRSLREAVRVFTAAWDDIVQRWHEYRQSEQPPPRPNIQVD